MYFWSRVLPVVLRYTYLQSVGTPAASLLWEEAHEWGSTVVESTIGEFSLPARSSLTPSPPGELRGFYSKSAQLIGSRPDLFPPQYCTRLAPFQDSAPAMEGALVVRIVESELGRRLHDLFSEFDAVPLGSASVAQVHRARLRSSGQVVAVKVQRPNMEALMLGDVANLKALGLQTRGRLPVDYYTVFAELEMGLQREFDSTQEAASMTRVADMLAAVPGGPPLRVPRPLKGLVSRRVIVMDFIPGTPLSRLAEAQPKGGGGLAAALLGRKLLRALTDAYCVMLLQEGFIHGDPHPGNIMIQPDGGVALIDFGQTKEIDPGLRRRLAAIVLQLDECRSAAADACDYSALAESALALGVVFKPSCSDVQPAAAALAMWLFDSTAASTLPGGYASNELSASSPVAQVASFPQALVFVGRATVLIRGLANRLGVDWSLAAEWAPAARALLQPAAAAAAAAAPVSGPAVWLLALRRRAAALLTRLVAAVLRLLTRLRGGERYSAPKLAL